MIRALRRRFLLIAMASLAGTLALLCLAINLGYRHMVTQRADTAVELLHRTDGVFPIPDAPVDPAAHGGFQVTLETPFETRYSIVHLTENREADINTKTMRYPFKLVHNLSANGNLSISNRWRLNFYTSYDFEAKKLAMTNINITRDLHCFSMTASIQLGVFNSYNFTIRASSSLLQDLKWEKRNSRNSNIQWY